MGNSDSPMNILGHQADPAAPGSLHSGEGRAGRVSGCQGNPPKQTMSKKKQKTKQFLYCTSCFSRLHGLLGFIFSWKFYNNYVLKA